jgi:hypothetical protein
MTVTEGNPRAQAPPRPGEPCEQCGSPLAADQRYCLNCGRRRGGHRVDYCERMRGSATAADGEPPASAAAPEVAEAKEPEKGQRDYAPLAAVGGIAVLGLMLLIGVLIGRGDGGTAPAPAPVVVQGGGAAAAGAGGAGTGGGEEAGAAGLGTSGGSGKSKQKKAKGGGEKASSEGAVTASEDDLAELESETGEEAAKNALKLPDKIATPGAPPPIDKSKPPGGGEGGAVTIK